AISVLTKISTSVVVELNQGNELNKAQKLSAVTSSSGTNIEIETKPTHKIQTWSENMKEAMSKKEDPLTDVPSSKKEVSRN
ncbi:7757_t:CDS:1, partial [Acaulospora colombiana]